VIPLLQGEIARLRSENSSLRQSNSGQALTIAEQDAKILALQGSGRLLKEQIAKHVTSKLPTVSGLLREMEALRDAASAIDAASGVQQGAGPRDVEPKITFQRILFNSILGSGPVQVSRFMIDGKEHFLGKELYLMVFGGGEQNDELRVAVLNRLETAVSNANQSKIAYVKVEASWKGLLAEVTEALGSGHIINKLLTGNKRRLFPIGSLVALAHAAFKLSPEHQSKVTALALAPLSQAPELPNAQWAVEAFLLEGVHAIRQKKRKEAPSSSDQGILASFLSITHYSS
jgi:hypothetical protein